MTALRNGSGNISLFEGCEGHVLPNHNAEAQASQRFFYVGLICAHSFLHGGYPFVGMSPAAITYIVSGSMKAAVEKLTVEDIPDHAIRQKLEKVCLPLSLYWNWRLSCEA